MQKNQELKKQADRILFEEGLNTIFSSLGETIYVGSYSMDLLAWRDIDLNIVVEKSKQLDAAKKLFQEMIDKPDLDRIKLYKDLLKKYRGQMPDSIYLGMVYKGWKFDVHFVEKSEVEKTLNRQKAFLNAMTSETRELILEIKNELVEKYGRCPMFSSFTMYQAILFENMLDKEQVYEYMKKGGAKIN